MLYRNPCLGCGACCAHYRVSFYWGETNESDLGATPQQFTEKLSDFYSCMKGTNSSHPHCVALQGKIGDWVSCAIYATRPSPCHEFGIKWQDGVLVFEPGDLERCNQARAAYGLPPISMGMSRHRHHCEHRANKARYTRVHHVVLASHARRTARSLYA